MSHNKWQIFLVANALAATVTWYFFNSSDGQVVRASASEAAYSAFIPSRVKSMTLKSVFTASVLDVQHYRDSVENKPASLLVVLLGKALSGISPSWYSRQVAGNFYASSL